MAHIPYYGEDLSPEPKTGKRRNEMIYNQEQLIKHNLKFYHTFIDLKVTGWKTYSKSLNDYTFGFFKNQLEQADSTVEEFAENAKGLFSTARGVCK